MGSELDPKDVLADLFGEPEFFEAVTNGNDEAAAQMAVQRLIDAGFKIVSAD